MANYEYRLSKDREILHEAVPLRTPFLLGIYTGDICNIKCHYCLHSLPAEKQKDINLAREFMSWDIFKKVADSTKKFPNKVKTVLFSSIGEPTLNPHLPKMISYIRELGTVNVIKMVTNGVALTKGLIDEIIGSGIDRIEISIQGMDAKMYKQNAGIEIDFENFFDNLSYLYENKKKCQIYMQTVDTCLDIHRGQTRGGGIY